MAIYVNKQRVCFHKTYIDRVPKLYIKTVDSFESDYLGIHYNITVQRNLKKSQFFWIVDFGALQVYWSEVYDQLHLEQMQSIVYSFIEQIVEQQKKDPYYEVCKSSVNGN